MNIVNSPDREFFNLIILNERKKDNDKLNEIDQTKVLKKIQYFKEILNCGFQPSIKKNLIYLKEQIKKQLIKKEVSMKKVIKINNLITNIETKKDIKNCWSIIYLFYSLSFQLNNNNNNNEQSFFFNKVEMEDSVVINEIPRIEEIPRFNENLILNEMNTNKRQSISLKNDNGLIRPLKRGKESNEEIVNEVEIIKDLIYVLQGIDGKYIQYDHNLKTYIINNDINLSRNSKSKIQYLIDIGNQFKIIYNIINSNDMSNDMNQGLILQSIYSFINNELKEYYGIIANIENELVNEKKISLNQMILFFNDINIKLNILFNLLINIQYKKSYQILSFLFQFIKHGDSQLTTLINRIICKCIMPYNKMIIEWIKYGTINNDPYNEYFIYYNHQQKEYLIKEIEIPNYLTIELAEKILIIGKSRKLIKNKEREGFNETLNQILKSNNLEEVINIQQLTIIEELINNEINYFLKNKIKIETEIINYYQLYLLGNGDFIKNLINSIFNNNNNNNNNNFSYYNNSMNQTYLINSLNTKLDTTLRDSNLNYLIGKLKIKFINNWNYYEGINEELNNNNNNIYIKNNNSSNNTNINNEVNNNNNNNNMSNNNWWWDKLIIEYQYQLNENDNNKEHNNNNNNSIQSILMNNKIDKLYQKMFNYLIKLKRIENQINLILMNNKYNLKNEFNSTQHLTLFKMVQFLIHYQSFCYYEIIMSKWNNIQQILLNNKLNLYQMNQQHEMLLISMINYCLLPESKIKNISLILIKLIYLIQQYCNLIIYQQDNNNNNNNNNNSLKNIKVKEKLLRLSVKFDNEVKNLILSILRGNDFFIPLAIKLDFNGFYLNK